MRLYKGLSLLGAVSMDRYKLLSDYQRACITKLYEYLGFNESVSYDSYLDFMFKNVKSTVSFEHMFNHNLKHIVKCFWLKNPQYRSNKYVTKFWVSEKDIYNSITVGSSNELDPKGVIRLFVKSNCNSIFNTKV